MRLKPITARTKSNAEWMALRPDGIGASEVGTILGLNPFQSAYELWRIRMGIDPPVQQNEAMLMGHLLEDAVAKRWEIETGNNVIAASQNEFMYIHPEKPYFRCSPDRTYWEAGATRNEDNKKILECKSTQMDIDRDNIPQNWFCQVEWNLFVGGKDSGSLAWLKMGREFGYTNIQYDEEFCQWLAENVERFWVDNIVGKKEPEATTVKDVLLKYPKHLEGKSITASQELIDTLGKLKEIKEVISSATATKEELEGIIKTAMCEAEAIVAEGSNKVLATWKSGKDKQKFDEKKFSAEHPDLYTEYCNTVPGSRTFLVKK